MAHSQVSDLLSRTSPLPHADITPWFLTSSCSPVPSPIPSPNCGNFSKRKCGGSCWQSPRGKAAPAGRNKRWRCGFLVGVFLRREEAAGKRDWKAGRGSGGAQASLQPGRRRGQHTASLQARRAAATKQFLEICSSSLPSQPPPSPPPFFKNTETRHCNQQSERKEGTRKELSGGTDQGREGARGLCLDTGERGECELSQESPRLPGLCGQGPDCARGQVDCGQVKAEEFGINCTSLPNLSFLKVTECRRQEPAWKLLCLPAVASPCQGGSLVRSGAPQAPQ